MIENLFTDGRTENEEIVDDAGKGLEEVKKATIATNNKSHELLLAKRDKMIKDEDAMITELEMLEEDD